MEDLILKSMSNFNFVELLCLVLLTKGITSMDKLSDSIKDLTHKISEFDKRIERIESRMERIIEDAKGRLMK